MNARDLMSTNLVVIPPETPVAAIAELLAARGISAVRPMSQMALLHHTVDPYRHPTDQVLLALGTDGVRGLSGAEVLARLEQHGANELTAEAPVPAWRKVLAQVQNVLVILLILGALMSVAGRARNGPAV